MILAGSGIWAGNGGSSFPIHWNVWVAPGSPWLAGRNLLYEQQAAQTTSDALRLPGVTFCPVIPILTYLYLDPIFAMIILGGIVL